MTATANNYTPHGDSQMVYIAHAVSRGYNIWYRTIKLAACKDGHTAGPISATKAVLKKLESALLSRFDYAFNKNENHSTRQLEFWPHGR